MKNRAALEASLELAVARIGDPQPAIYARLFALHPAMEAEFWRDTSGRIRFSDFLPVVAAVIRDGCGDDFTPAMAAAWDVVLDRAAATLAALPGSSNEARVIDVDDVLPPVGERGLPFPMR